MYEWELLKIGGPLATLWIRVVPKIRDTFLGVPAIRIIVHWGLYWQVGSPYSRKLPYRDYQGVVGGSIISTTHAYVLRESI